MQKIKKIEVLTITRDPVKLYKPLLEYKIIDHSLKDLQALVKGRIEPVYINNNNALICNEDGKYIDGFEPSAVIIHQDHVVDIIYGPCFVCGLGYDDFASVNKPVGYGIYTTDEGYILPAFFFE